MDAKELWEETVRQMREDAEFQDESVMYAQGEIDRLRAENERLRDILGDAHRVICDQEDQLRRLIYFEDIDCECVILDIREILPNA